MGKTNIAWTDYTINLWWGCHTTSNPGCDNCYAARFAERYGFDVWNNERRRLIVNAFDELDKLERKAIRENWMIRVFVGSMMDLFEESVPVYNPSTEFPLNFEETGMARMVFFERIHAGRYAHLELQLLTKRPWSIRKFIPADWWKECPQNVLFGTSVADQSSWDQYVTGLIDNTPTDARVFVSAEPLVKEIARPFWMGYLNWLIIGGESGPGFRPMNPGWAWSLIQEARAERVPVFMKQDAGYKSGLYDHLPAHFKIREFPEPSSVRRPTISGGRLPLHT